MALFERTVTKVIKVEEKSDVMDGIVLLTLSEDVFWKRNSGTLTIALLPNGWQTNGYEEKVKGAYSLLEVLFDQFELEEAEDLIRRHEAERKRKSA